MINEYKNFKEIPEFIKKLFLVRGISEEIVYVHEFTVIKISEVLDGIYPFLNN